MENFRDEFERVLSKPLKAKALFKNGVEKSGPPQPTFNQLN
ncbi:hypothetical protein ACFSR8_05630 [Hyunsoonleella rubra]|uniref:Uncharacterized protein n=1 Tax=Hyunsoonleella rubra TaxID=1737062 RepID=A0ABW5T9I3_9FLAO